MEIRILGAYNLESSQNRLISLLVDDVLAIDAGSLTSSLSFSEQRKIKAIFISHHHFDHIRDLNTFGLTWSYSLTTPIYSIPPILEALTSTFLHGKNYPDFLRWPSKKPAFELHSLEPYKTSEVLGYKVLPLPVVHTCPTVGFEITSPQGRKFFYTSDTGPGLSSIWGYTSPDLLIAEVTVPNRLEEFIKEAGHLTPSLLQQELEGFKKQKGYLPPVLIIHLNPFLKEEIEKEIRKVAEVLEAQITLAYDGMRIEV